MRSPTHSEGATVSAMNFYGPAGFTVTTYDDEGTADIDGIAVEIEPEELRLMAKACTQAAQHLEAARR